MFNDDGQDEQTRESTDAEDSALEVNPRSTVSVGTNPLLTVSSPIPGSFVLELKGGGGLTAIA